MQSENEIFALVDVNNCQRQFKTDPFYLKTAK